MDRYNNCQNQSGSAGHRRAVGEMRSSGTSNIMMGHNSDIDRIAPVTRVGREGVSDEINDMEEPYRDSRQNEEPSTGLGPSRILQNKSNGNQNRFKNSEFIGSMGNGSRPENGENPFGDAKRRSDREKDESTNVAAILQECLELIKSLRK